MPWLLLSPGHQQPWYSTCRISPCSCLLWVSQCNKMIRRFKNVFIIPHTSSEGLMLSWLCLKAIQQGMYRVWEPSDWQGGSDISQSKCSLTEAKWYQCPISSNNFHRSIVGGSKYWQKYMYSISHKLWILLVVLYLPGIYNYLHCFMSFTYPDSSEFPLWHTWKKHTPLLLQCHWGNQMIDLDLATEFTAKKL